MSDTAAGAETAGASASRHLVSVVVETITARYDAVTVGSIADDLSRTLSALQAQSYPASMTEVIVVVDRAVAPAAAAEVTRRFPFVRLAASNAENYCAAKNAGASASRGSIIALLDGDCEPALDWLERLVDAFGEDVAAVAGRTRYEIRSFRARALSITDFAHVTGDDSGGASGFNINNVAFRREVLLQHPLDDRIRRNGGCTLLYHQLTAAGMRVVYEPAAQVSHGDGDISGLYFVRKHFGRGFDSVDVYRLDETELFRGTKAFRKLGVVALFGITARRILLDWRRLVAMRRQVGVSAVGVPYVAAVGASLRVIELAGMIANVLRLRPYGSHPEHASRLTSE